MGMDAEIFAGDDARDLSHDAFDLVGQRSAVGVAQHRPARAGVDRGAGAGKRVFRVGLVAVEEMLAIDHRLAARGDRRLHAVGDGLEVLVERAAERDMDVIVPRLGDIDDRVGVGGEEAGKARIVGGRAARPLGHAEGAEAGAAGGLLFEEFRVERVRARIAALDIVDSEPVEHRRDAALVVEREVDAGGQRAVAHRRVEQIEAFFGHGALLSVGSEASDSRAERLGHGGVGEPLVAHAHEIALLRGEAQALEQGFRDIARLCGQALRAARLRQPRQGVDQRSADALAGEFGIDEQHVDLVRALEAGEAGDRAVDHGEEGQGLGEPRAESLFVVGARRPGLALLLVIVFGRQLLDARAKDLGAAFCVGREIGAKSDGAHRFELPGRRAVLVVLDGDAERGEFVAQAVGFGPVLAPRGRRCVRRLDRHSILSRLVDPASSARAQCRLRVGASFAAAVLEIVGARLDEASL